MTPRIMQFGLNYPDWHDRRIIPMTRQLVSVSRLAALFAICLLLVPVLYANAQEVRLLVLDASASVLRYDGITGEFLDVMIPPDPSELVIPKAITLGPDGDLYISLRSGVRRYDGTTGEFLELIVPGPGDDLTFGPDGNLYVSHTVGIPSVGRYDGITGEIIGGFGDLELLFPQGLSFGPDGSLYVAMPSCVERFNAITGESLNTFIPCGSNGLSFPSRLTFGPGGNLYINSSFDRIIRYDGTTGEFLDKMAVDFPGDLTFGPDGHLYVISSSIPPGILRYDTTRGEALDTFIPFGRGGLRNPVDLIFQQPLVPLSLTVEHIGNGRGTVVSSPLGIDCGNQCTHEFLQNTQVTLAATPAPGSTWAGWHGSICTGLAPCRVTMTQALTVAAIFDPAPALSTSNWSPTASMNIARAGHTATVLLNGKILVAGGLTERLRATEPSVTATTELFDPEMGTWILASSMNFARSEHSATLLPNGKVLVAGGFPTNFSRPISSAEVYDPDTDTWSIVASMNRRRADHIAVLLLNGNVLIPGGFTGSFSNATAEMYDPIFNRWALVRNMLAARDSRTHATLLPDGRVLVTGGDASAEIYDPTTGIWSFTDSMLEADRDYHLQLLLPNGKVLVAGGRIMRRVNSLSSTELFDPVNETWSIVGNMNIPKDFYLHSYVALHNGRVLAAGQANVNSSLVASSELYNPVINSWEMAGIMQIARLFFTMTLLPDDTVLVAGGRNFIDLNTVENSAEIFSPESGPTAAIDGNAHVNSWEVCGRVHNENERVFKDLCKQQ